MSVPCVLFCTFLLLFDDGSLRRAVAESADNASDDVSEYAPKTFIILKSTKNYDQAHKFAVSASKRLKTKLDLRGLVPIPGGGLNLSKDARGQCEKEDSEINCNEVFYFPRGRSDDGVYISIEYSNAYTGYSEEFPNIVAGTPKVQSGFYIVIYAHGSPDEMKKLIRRAKSVYPDAYGKTLKIYEGCMH